MPSYFHPFILPFCIGTVVLFVIIAVKFYRWISTLDRKQKKNVWMSLFTVRVFPALWRIVKEIAKEVLLHVNITRYNWRMGYMHRSIALGWFLLIVTGFVETLFHFRGGGHLPWLGIFFRFFVRDYTYGISRVWADVMDLLLLYVLSGVSIAIFKSIYSRVVGIRKNTKLRWFDICLRYSLWLIFPMRLLSESCTAALTGNGGFLTQGIGDMLPTEFAQVMEVPFWTAYSTCLCVFFVLFPFSRYMHIFTEPLLIVFRSLGVRESSQPTGYTRMELNACSRCGICIDGCPLDKELKINDIQGVYLLRDVRHGLPHRNATENCLMCDQCVVDCPVGIEITEIRKQERNKGALDTHDNYRFLDSIQSFNAIGRIAYFGGCMSHLTPGVTESMKKIFDAVGQKYWMMDEDKTICCGRPLLQQGFIAQAAELRRKNAHLIVESHAQYLVTSCPICYQSFKKEYNLPIKVIHHTEYLAALIRLGKLKPHKTGLKVAYHDPCELGRGCNIYDEPREVLQAVAELARVQKEREHSICCGHSLGNTALDVEKQDKVRDAALRNLKADHPDLIATACPMCKKAFQRDRYTTVKDIAELIAEQL